MKKVLVAFFSLSASFHLFLPSLLIRCCNNKTVHFSPNLSKHLFTTLSKLARHLLPSISCSKHLICPSLEPNQSWAYHKLAWESPVLKMPSCCMICVDSRNQQHSRGLMIDLLASSSCPIAHWETLCTLSGHLARQRRIIIPRITKLLWYGKVVQHS